MLMDSTYGFSGNYSRVCCHGSTTWNESMAEEETKAAKQVLGKEMESTSFTVALNNPAAVINGSLPTQLFVFT